MGFRQKTAITSPNMGLYFDRPKIDVPRRALIDGINFRCKNGNLESQNLGWKKFATWKLNGSAKLIDNFFPRNDTEKLIFGSLTDLYLYDADTGTVSFITPIYSTGTASASGTAVTGSGTSWSTNAKGGDQISFGSNSENDPDATWYTIASVDSDTGLTLSATAGTVASGDYTIRKTFQTTADGEWSVDTFVNDSISGDDLWIATNGIDYVVSWNGEAATVTSHPELGFTCKTLASYSNMMIYGNLTINSVVYPQQIINSDVSKPLLAGDVGTGLSEQFTVFNSTDGILNMLVLGDYLIIYADRTIVPAQFVGDPFVFTFRVAISGVGPISANAIADFGDFHEFLGSDAGYLFDGVTLKTTNDHVWRNILRQADPMRRSQAFGHFDEEQGDLIWSIPGNSDAGVGVLGASAEIGWTEHYLEDPGEGIEGSPFSKRNFPFTITGFYEQDEGLKWSTITQTWREFNFAWNDQFFQAAFPINLAGDSDGQIWIFNQTQTANGDPLPSFARTGRQALTSGRERDLLTRIYPFATTAPYNLDVTLYMGDTVGGSIASKGTVEYDMSQPEGGHFVVFYRRGRVMEIEFGSAAGDPWVISGFDYDTRNGGRR